MVGAGCGGDARRLGSCCLWRQPACGHHLRARLRPRRGRRRRALAAVGVRFCRHRPVGRRWMGRLRGSLGGRPRRRRCGRTHPDSSPCRRAAVYAITVGHPGAVGKRGRSEGSPHCWRLVWCHHDGAGARLGGAIEERDDPGGHGFRVVLLQEVTGSGDDFERAGAGYAVGETLSGAHAEHGIRVGEEHQRWLRP